MIIFLKPRQPRLDSKKLLHNATKDKLIVAPGKITLAREIIQVIHYTEREQTARWNLPAPSPPAEDYSGCFSSLLF